MSPSRPFILRPVATSLLMAGILLAGFVAYKQLPVSALPQVDYPTIQVLTFYPGASPDVMVSSITAPLERQFGQIPGLNQMMSTSSYGSSIVTLQFSLELNIDVAEQQVQAAESLHREPKQCRYCQFIAHVGWHHQRVRICWRLGHRLFQRIRAPARQYHRVSGTQQRKRAGLSNAASRSRDHGNFHDSPTATTSILAFTLSLPAHDSARR